MDPAQKLLQSTDLDALDFGFFFNNLDYCLSKGRGFSLFNSEVSVVDCFVQECNRKNLQPQIIRLSAKDSKPDFHPDIESFVILIQDLPYPDFLQQASELADKLFFPLWFKRIPICFFSHLGRGSYENRLLNGNSLHKQYSL